MRKIYLMLGLLVAGNVAVAQGETCATAVAVTPGTYTADGPATGGGAVGDGFNADWYSFTPTCNGTIDVNSCISGGIDTDLFIYEAVCPVSVVESIIGSTADDACAGTFSSEATNVPVTAGTIYYIEWTDDWSTSGFDWELIFNLSGPGGLAVTGTTFSTANLDWADSGASDWVLEWGVAGFTPGTGTIWNITTSSDTVLTGLNPETTYEFYVSTTGPCAGTTGPFAFTTDPVCPVPTATASTPGPTDAFLDWTPGGTEVVWQVEYGTNGFLLGSGTQGDVYLGSDTTVTGLMGLTDYHWYVRAVCDVTAPLDTFSLWVGPESFTTGQPCADPSNLDTTMSDAFNAGLIWTPGGLETEWNVQWGETGFPLGGTGSNAVNGVTTLPESLTGLTPGMTYDFYVQAVCGASPDSSSMWVGPYTWTQPIFCVDPSAGGFTNLTTNSVDFGWTVNGSETNWTVEYGVNGFTLGSGTSVPSTNDTIAVTGLSGGTDYCFYVQANCGSTADSSSAWVGPFCITTPVSCPQPTNLNAINITTTAANLMWQAGGTETEWDLEWGQAGFTPGTGSYDGNVNPTSSNPYYATGLQVGAQYEFYVRGICGAGDTSAWSGPYGFQTLCGTLVAPYLQTFDGQVATPPCFQNLGIEGWSFQVSGGFGPGYAVAGSVDHTSGTGNFAWIDASGGTPGIQTNELITPMIDISALTIPQAGFWILSNNTNDQAQNTITLEVWNGFGWTLLGEYGGNNAEWVEIAYTLPMGIPTLTQFRLIQVPNTQGGSDFYNDLLVDDFFVREEIPCPPVSAGTANTPPFCQDGSGTVELFDALTGYTSGDGVFYFPDAQNPTQTFTANAGSMLLTGLVEGTDYTFDYVENNGCNADTVSLTYNWVTQPNAGGDGTVTTCVNHPVVLINELNGFVDQGGTWNDDDNAGYLVNGIFDPEYVAAGTYNFTYVVDNGSCSDSSVVTVTVDDCASVEENGIVLGVYPNPVKDVLNVALNNVDGQVTTTLFSVQGAVVEAPVAVNNSIIEMDLSNVADGVYVLRVMSNGQSQEVRIVKQ